MACTSLMYITSSPANEQQSSLRRALSGNDHLRPRMKRSHSDNQYLCYSLNRIRASANPPKLKNSHSSIGLFNILQLPDAIFPNTSMEMDMEEINSVGMEGDEDNKDMVETSKKRANWIERLMELRSQWRERQGNDSTISRDGGGEQGCDEDGEDVGCDVDEYGDIEEEEEEEGMSIDNRSSFSRLLVRVSWSDAKLFARLAFLSNMAYVILEIKPKELRRTYGLQFVTSSLEKKGQAAILKAKLGRDQSTRVPGASAALTVYNNPDKARRLEEKRPKHPTVAYEIAASAASYVQSCTKDLLSLGSETKRITGDVSKSHGNEDRQQEEEGSPSPRVYKSEVAAYMAASTMTTVVTAGEKEKQEAARELQSLHSSPCDWYICDDPNTNTRSFIVQGSDSLASWYTNLFFEPTKFEGTGVLVHRGIYEAAKGIYQQVMPEIMEHLNRFGEQAKLQFTGHSLGGSLSLLVNLMLVTRRVVKPFALRPVVTFGSPFVFCGGEKIFAELGLDEDSVHCVMMHRDIVPRAFACNYPDRVAQLLKRLHGSFQSHPCLNKKKLLYSPMGKMFILQPDEKSSPPHPLLPPGSAMYAFKNTQCRFTTKSAIRAFLNSPHPLDTLSDPTAYGSKGTILRDHDSSNYLKAVNGFIRQQTKTVVDRKARKQKSPLWPILTSQSSHAWRSHDQHDDVEDSRMVTKEVMTSV